MSFGRSNPMSFGRSNPMSLGQSYPMSLGQINPMSLGQINSMSFVRSNPMSFGRSNPTFFGRSCPIPFDGVTRGSSDRPKHLYLRDKLLGSSPFHIVNRICRVYKKPAFTYLSSTMSCRPISNSLSTLITLTSTIRFVIIFTDW